MSTNGPPDLVIRVATVADAGTIAQQRAAMWLAMGRFDENGAAVMTRVTRDALERLMPLGSYRGWLAAPASEPERAIGGVGLHLRESLPRIEATGRISGGVQALVVNVYTEPAWRRRGVAARLMREALAWCTASKIGNVILHASDEGRPLYESLGFVSTNEMRYAPPAPESR